jgi:hypothetical protein
VQKSSEIHVLSPNLAFLAGNSKRVGQKNSQNFPYETALTWPVISWPAPDRTRAPVRTNLDPDIGLQNCADITPAGPEISAA